MLLKQQAANITKKELGDIAVLRDPKSEEFILDIGVVPRVLKKIIQKMGNIQIDGIRTDSLLDSLCCSIRGRFQICIPSVARAILQFNLTNSEFYLNQFLVPEKSILSLAAEGVLFLKQVRNPSPKRRWWGEFANSTTATDPKFIAVAPTIYMGELVSCTFFTNISFQKQAQTIYSVPAKANTGNRGEECFVAMLCMRLTFFEGQKIFLEHLFPDAEIYGDGLPPISPREGKLERSELQLFNRKKEVNLSSISSTEDVVLCSKGTYGIDMTTVLESANEYSKNIFLAIQTKFGSSGKYHDLSTFVNAVKELEKNINDYYHVVACIAVQGNVLHLTTIRQALKNGLVLYHGVEEYSIGHFFIGAEHRFGFHSQTHL
eukprot:gb/GECH01008134.1/.p1 GENE.gb/GECH01008134.1/~~gb/GECH01008134.1/.p1  ORF type:complete len:375 (+),score=24.56 gb/GECH01008134.1/:1-1125(+)